MGLEGNLKVIFNLYVNRKDCGNNKWFGTLSQKCEKNMWETEIKNSKYYGILNENDPYVWGSKVWIAGSQLGQMF